MSGHVLASAQANPARIRTRLRQLLVRAWLGVLALSIAGCGTTLRPLIISTDLAQGNYAPTGEPKTCQAPEGGASFHGDLPKSICRVNVLRVRYLEGVVDDAQLKNLLGLGLIAASAYGIYKGITSSGDGTQRMLARLGIGAGAAYAYGENFISEPRQRTYLAGSDALGCAVLASTAYLYTTAEFGTEGDATNVASLQGALAATIDATAALDDAVTRIAKDWSAKQVNQSTCNPSRKPAPGAAGTSQEDSDALTRRSAASAQEQGSACQSDARRQLVNAATAAKSDVDSALKEALRATASAHESINTGNALVGRIKNASAQLEARASEIQTQVAIEVAKTQPNLAAIFQGGESLRLNAAAFSGSTLFKPSGGGGIPKAQAAVEAAANIAQAQNQALIDQARRDIDSLQQLQSNLFVSKARLDGWIARSQERARQVGNLSACKFDGNASGVLELTPDVTDIQLPPNGSFTWFVHGVTGRPQTYGVGMYLDNVKANVVGQSVTLTLAQALPEGQSALWMITDSSGGAHREVRISNAGAGSVPANTTATGIKNALSTDQLIQICRRFGMPDARDASCIRTGQMKDKVKACEEALERNGKPHSEIDAKNAMLEGGQCPPPPN